MDVSYIVHATEDVDRVKDAVMRLLEIDAGPELEEMSGHFGNPILKGAFHLHGEEAERSFGALRARLPPELKSKIVNELSKLIDEHSSLFLRFDKQRMVKGELAEGTNDVVRIKVKPRAFLMKDSASDFFAGMLEAG
jgi:RNA binding exosome subunit